MRAVYPHGMTLDLLAPGTSARIRAIDWEAMSDGDGKRLRALGIDAEAEVGIAHRGVFGGRDPVAVTIGRSMIALRRAHAAAIAIDPA